jgi:hypothetical protein
VGYAVEIGPLILRNGRSAQRKKRQFPVAAQKGCHALTMGRKCLKIKGLRRIVVR